MAVTYDLAQAVVKGHRFGNFTIAPVASTIEAAGQSFVQGQPLIFSSGKIAVAANNTVVVNLAGFALQDASGTTNAEIKVAEAQLGMMLMIQYYKATPAATAITLRNAPLNLITVNGLLHIDGDDAVNWTKTVVRIREFVDSNGKTVDPGDTNGWVIAEIVDLGQ